MITFFYFHSPICHKIFPCCLDSLLEKADEVAKAFARFYEHLKNFWQNMKDHLKERWSRYICCRSKRVGNDSKAELRWAGMQLYNGLFHKYIGSYLFLCVGTATASPDETKTYTASKAKWKDAEKNEFCDGGKEKKLKKNILKWCNMS